MAVKGLPLSLRKHVLVVVNPTAGSRRRERLCAIINRLRNLGSAVTIHETKARGDAERIMGRTSGDNVDVIAVAGGDGTFNEVLNGLPDEGPPLAILPFGTVNVLAKEIGMPSSIDGLARTVAFGPIRPISLGEANGRRFAMMASVGFDAGVVEHVDLNLKRAIGRWAYLYEAMKQFMTPSQPRFRLRVNGGPGEYDVSGVIMANGHYYAGRYVTEPTAHLEKVSLDVCQMTGFGRLALLRYGLSLALGRFAKQGDICIEEMTELAILGPVGAPVQADGDVLCRLPATIRVLPAAVDLVFPDMPADLDVPS